MKSGDLSIIIYSCWRNRDMWKVFSILFRKYWNDCRYKVILLTDRYEKADEDYVFDEVVCIDDTWAKMLKRAMQVCDTPYVSLWMDDYLLCDYVSNEDIQKQVERIKQYKAVNLRLIESPESSGIYQNNCNIGYYRQGEAYCLALQVGIWDRHFLERFLKDEWSAWDFEKKGSLRMKKSRRPILAALDYVFPYEEGVRKGKWMVQGASLCRRNGIRLDLEKRPVMTNLEMAKIYFQGAVIDMNPTLVVRLQNMISRTKRKT